LKSRLVSAQLIYNAEYNHGRKNNRDRDCPSSGPGPDRTLKYKVRHPGLPFASEDDVFLGEMSFLLNNRRSATVKAASGGRLIRVSKREFVDAIKKKPHYALLLARLLAQRIHRINLSSSKKILSN
jgi:hypothetical protein